SESLERFERFPTGENQIGFVGKSWPSDIPKVLRRDLASCAGPGNLATFLHRVGLRRGSRVHVFVRQQSDQPDKPLGKSWLFSCISAISPKYAKLNHVSAVRCPSWRTRRCSARTVSMWASPSLHHEACDAPLMELRARGQAAASQAIADLLLRGAGGGVPKPPARPPDNELPHFPDPEANC